MREGESKTETGQYAEYGLVQFWMPTKQMAEIRRLGWMSQSTDVSKEKNFFETRVTEYRTAGSLDWD
jgi:hypothetical protein